MVMAKERACCLPAGLPACLPASFSFVLSATRVVRFEYRVLSRSLCPPSPSKSFSQALACVNRLQSPYDLTFLTL